MRFTNVVSVFLFCFFLSCIGRIEPPTPSKVEGFLPVYSTNITELKRIIAVAPRPSIRGGKIYTVGNLLYQVEQDSGIHVINYANPSAPRKVGFIRSFLCKEVSVKNGFIYTNNLSDLVVIDTRNWNSVREISRVKNVFPDLENQYPPNPDAFNRVYFECPDRLKGTVIAWKRDTITNPQCWR